MTQPEPRTVTREQLAAVLRDVMRRSHGPDGPNDLRGDDPHEWLADAIFAALRAKPRDEALRTALIQHWEANPHHECHAVCADDILTREARR